MIYLLIFTLIVLDSMINQKNKNTIILLILLFLPFKSFSIVQANTSIQSIDDFEEAISKLSHK